MSTKAHISGVVLLACVLVVSSAAARGGASERAKFKVTSTLDGKKVLPARLHWLARPQLPSSDISRVDFLIDGKLRWIENHAPYNYGSDDNGRNRGFLITTWLAPGRHRFTVRVTDKQGGKASHTTTARVLPAPPPPAELRGVWTRDVSVGPLAGKWRLIFDRAGAWHLDPLGTGVGNQYAAQPGVIKVYAPIQMSPLIKNRTTTRRYGATVGGFDCNPAGPFGSYRWSVADDKLTLTAIKERCRGRGFIWGGGVWARAS